MANASNLWYVDVMEADGANTHRMSVTCFPTKVSLVHHTEFQGENSRSQSHPIIRSAHCGAVLTLYVCLCVAMASRALFPHGLSGAPTAIVDQLACLPTGSSQETRHAGLGLGR